MVNSAFDDEINNEIKGIRTVTSDQYDIYENLGKGKLAQVKSAMLHDQFPSQQAAAKFNFCKIFLYSSILIALALILIRVGFHQMNPIDLTLT